MFKLLLSKLKITTDDNSKIYSSRNYDNLNSYETFKGPHFKNKVILKKTVMWLFVSLVNKVIIVKMIVNKVFLKEKNHDF